MTDFKVICTQNLENFGFNSRVIFTHTVSLIYYRISIFNTLRDIIYRMEEKIKPNTNFCYQLAIDLTSFKITYGSAHSGGQDQNQEVEVT